MSTYNGERYVEKAILSILDQTYKDFNLIILDDKSTDRTLDIVQNKFGTDSRVTIFSNKKRLGMIYTWNKLLQLADLNTQYFAWLSDHDIFSPYWLESLLKIHRSTIDLTLAYAHSQAINAEGQIVYDYSKFEHSINSSKVIQRIYTLFSKDILYGNLIYGLFDFTKLKKIRGYPYVLLPDTVTIWMAALEGKICFTKDASWFRRHYDMYSLDRQRRSLGIRLNNLQVICYPITNAIYLFKHSKQSLVIRILLIVLYSSSIGQKQLLRSLLLFFKRIVAFKFHQ